MTAGPPSGPSLAESYDPLGQHRDDPYPIYAQARQAPLFYSERLAAWVVTRHDDVVEVLRHPEVYSSRNALRPLTPLPDRALAVLAGSPATGLSVTATDGEQHRRLRTPLSRMLTVERVSAMAGLIRQRAEELLDTFAATTGRQTDFVESFSAPFPALVILDLLGVEAADREEALHGARQSAVWISDVPLAEAVQVQAVTDTVALQHLLGRYLKRRHADPRDDLFSHTAAAFAPDGQALDGERLGDAITPLWTIIMAGYSTTADGLATAVRHLLTHRAQWELLCAKPDLLAGAVEELIRYDSPVQSFFRLTTRAVTLDGTRLPAGAEVLIVYGSANRDPATCARADELDITRPPARHLSFAYGMHYCLGAELSRLELQIALEALTTRFPTLRLVPDQLVEYVPNIRVRGPRQLLVTW